MSLSGLFSRLFVYHYPQEVAGMVLVDVAHEKMYKGTPVEWVELNKQLEGLLTLCGANYRTYCSASFARYLANESML